MNKVEGLHHLAITTANMKEQIEFFTDKLGMELMALYWMHGIPNTYHGFVQMGKSCIAFVQGPNGALHHFSFWLDDWDHVRRAADLLADGVDLLVVQPGDTKTGFQASGN